MRAFEGFENRSNVFDPHSGDVFKEWDQSYKGLILGISSPFGKDDCIFGLPFGVGLMGIDEDDFGKITV